MTPSLYEGIKEVSVTDTDTYQACPHCGSANFGASEFEKGLNHLLQAHKGRLLHVGQETGYDASGELQFKTVAVVGFVEDPFVGAK